MLLLTLWLTCLTIQMLKRVFKEVEEAIDQARTGNNQPAVKE